VIALATRQFLLAEVNHRVAHSLLILALDGRAEAKAAKDKASKDLLSEVQTRIYAISAVHQWLYSSGGAIFVDLGKYLPGQLGNIETAMRDEGRAASLEVPDTTASYSQPPIIVMGAAPKKSRRYSYHILSKSRRGAIGQPAAPLISPPLRSTLREKRHLISWDSRNSFPRRGGQSARER
jgi:hypothetical protein